MHPFNINFLDHVAIYVIDMERSIQWYESVIGLKKYQPEVWGEFPVFMLTGKTGIAIFPANLKEAPENRNTKFVKIDHFAFNLTNDDFIKAQNYLKEIGENFDFQDHHYFHSIYLKDPDGHKVELTTIRVKEEDFY